MARKSRQFLRMILVFLLSVLSFSLDFYVPGKIVLRFPGWSELAVVCLAAFCARKDFRVKWNEVIVALIFTAFLLIGRGTFAYEWDTRIPFENGQHIIQWLVALPGFFLVCIILVHHGFQWMSQPGLLNRTDAEQWYVPKHLFACFFGGMLILQLPSFILCFPGIMIPGDNFHQIAQFTKTVIHGEPILTGQHPLAHTFLLGGMIWIGKLIFGSETLGYGTYTALQMVICLLIYARAACYLYEVGVPVKYCSGVVLFWGLNPAFSTMLVTSTKDVLYAAFLLLFAVELCREMQGSGRMVGLLLAGIGTVLFRNEGIYVTLGALICLMFISRSKKNCTVALVGLVAVHLLIGNVIFPMFHFQKGSPREMLSVPMQTMAKYIIGHKGEWPEEDEKAIATVLDIDSMPEWYDENSVDTVKYISALNAKGTLDNTDVLNFMKVWIKLGIRHPMTFIDGFLEFKNQMIYPTKLTWISNTYGNEFITENSQHSFDALRTSDIYLHYPEFLKDIRRGFESFRIWLKGLPVVRMFCISATYVWLTIALAFFFLEKGKRKTIPLTVVSILILLVAFVSPLDGGHFRYVYPLAIILPFLLLINLTYTQKA